MSVAVGVETGAVVVDTEPVATENLAAPDLLNAINEVEVMHGYSLLVGQNTGDPEKPVTLQIKCSISYKQDRNGILIDNPDPELSSHNRREALGILDPTVAVTEEEFRDIVGRIEGIRSYIDYYSDQRSNDNVLVTMERFMRSLALARDVGVFLKNSFLGKLDHYQMKFEDRSGSI